RYARHIQLSESAMAVLETFKDQPEKRLKAAEIVNSTDLPRRTVQYALRSLTEAGFIQRLGRGAATRYQLVF
ncbi:MAG: helix-turn-helix domain-containing protein, partial [Desulfobacterales bacterium]